MLEQLQAAVYCSVPYTRNVKHVILHLMAKSDLYDCHIIPHFIAHFSLVIYLSLCVMEEELL